MNTKRYTASLSRSQGRSAWSVIFRHPGRIDPNTRRPGLRVRQGLGTDDEARANALKDELNELLANEAYWIAAARVEAERRYSQRVVEIFFHGMQPEETNYSGIRDEFISLPSSTNSDYRTALLLGTTGAGKTTLLRQIIGTDPKSERFPSTSTAKTTVHDTEVILVEGPYRVIVTFYPLEEVREHLNECISEAVLAAYQGEDDHDVLRKLLNHVNQRFRFNYVLGSGVPGSESDVAEDDDDYELHADVEAEDDDPEEGAIDLQATNELLQRCVVDIRAIAGRHGDALRSELGAATEKDQRVIDELFEEELDRRLREDDAFHRIADDLMEEIEQRFALLKVGTLRRNKQGWPLSWSWETPERTRFIETVARFSSNHAPKFGRLLTPLVNGVRVAGPFVPTWGEGPPKLVLLDGEGLGHTPKSVAAISTNLVRRIDVADAVLLVDSATQPMQAASVAAMREVVSSGNADKLLLVFTHFDMVKGDNLLTNIAKEEHVLASAENVLASVGEELGPFAERALRGRLKAARYFVAGIDAVLTPEKKKSHGRTIAALKALLLAIDNIVDRREPVKAQPVYDSMNLALAVSKAAEGFHDAWWPRLGLAYKQGATKEHWKRIWALTRRLATPGMGDEYDSLKPVADLRLQLQARLFVLIQSPLAWDPEEPANDDDKLQVFNALAESLARRMLDVASRRVRAERLPEWQSAYAQSGRGSSYTRAAIIGEQIYDRAAPIPDVTPSPDRNAFLHEVAATVSEACAEVGAKLK